MMNIEGLKTLTELEAFLEGTQMAVCNIPGGTIGNFFYQEWLASHARLNHIHSNRSRGLGKLTAQLK